MINVSQKQKDRLEVLAKALNAPTTTSRLGAEKRFLDENLFLGLQDLKPWFDNSAIKHFAAEQFLVVIERCTELGIKITGIEIFRFNGTLVDVHIANDEKPGNDWCSDLVHACGQELDLSFCASYLFANNGEG